MWFIRHVTPRTIHRGKTPGVRPIALPVVCIVDAVLLVNERLGRLLSK